MLAFPSMLVGAAEKAGMAVPPDPDNFVDKQYPHFAVFCNTQLARPMSDPSEHWHNAEVIASVPEDEIMRVTLLNLVKRGLRYTF